MQQTSEMRTRERHARTDWAASWGSYGLAWGVPMLAVVAGAYFDALLRGVVWALALAWMGLACMQNARQCGRTHCRYTGPYYLLLAIPVMLHATNAVPLGAYGWWFLGAGILAGGKLIWWVSEARWGRYRQ